MEIYYKKKKIVGPKEEKLKEALSELDIVEKKMNIKLEELDKI